MKVIITIHFFIRDAIKEKNSRLACNKYNEMDKQRIASNATDNSIIKCRQNIICKPKWNDNQISQ